MEMWKLGCKSLELEVGITLLIVCVLEEFKVSFSELKGPQMLDGNDGNDLTPEYYSHFEVVVHYTRFHFMTLRQDI